MNCPEKSSVLTIGKILSHCKRWTSVGGGLDHKKVTNPGPGCRGHWQYWPSLSKVIFCFFWLLILAKISISRFCHVKLTTHLLSEHRCSGDFLPKNRRWTGTPDTDCLVTTNNQYNCSNLSSLKTGFKPIFMTRVSRQHSLIVRCLFWAEAGAHLRRFTTARHRGQSAMRSKDYLNIYHLSAPSSES